MLECKFWPRMKTWRGKVEALMGLTMASYMERYLFYRIAILV